MELHQGSLQRPFPPGSLDAGARASDAHTKPRNQDGHRRRGQRGGAQLYTAGGLALVVARDAASAQPSLGGYALPQRANYTFAIFCLPLEAPTTYLPDGQARDRRTGTRGPGPAGQVLDIPARSEEHTSELQSLMRNSYAVLCLKKKKN